ncbi:MAG: family hydrolase protein [Herbaspirillum sp.]|jgi:diadenosine tetraphosphate (Ap4A) HIT family hydrolase|nr:family hydrolase protein [Herbaspirillum sp.]
MSACDQCELCHADGGEVLFRNADYRVVLVDDAGYPGFCRVIWNAHVGEMTSLAPTQRAVLMDAVWCVESALRETLQPTKINLASLGNMTAHLHWHLIPRFSDDAHFPNPIWAQPQREASPASLASRKDLLPQLRQAVTRHLAASH